ncbi:MAG: acyl carrier protein [Pyrinomonadaceae bacterium]
MTHEEITQKVADVLVQALGVSRSEVRPETSLVADLEAESIDFLDIVFRIEKEFGIEVSRGELFPQEMLRDSALISNGELADAGAVAMRGRFAFTDTTAIKAGENVEDLMNDLLTVQLIVDYVTSKLKDKQTALAA